MSYSNKEVTSMLQQNKSSHINETVADILVHIEGDLFPDLDEGLPF